MCNTINTHILCYSPLVSVSRLSHTVGGVERVPEKFGAAVKNQLLAGYGEQGHFMGTERGATEGRGPRGGGGGEEGDGKRVKL